MALERGLDHLVAVCRQLERLDDSRVIERLLCLVEGEDPGVAVLDRLERDVLLARQVAQRDTGMGSVTSVDPASAVWTLAL